MDDDVRAAFEILSILLFLIDLSRNDPEHVSYYVQMAKPALEHLQIAAHRGNPVLPIAA
jgi:hypothetical protein